MIKCKFSYLTSLFLSSICMAQVVNNCNNLTSLFENFDSYSTGNVLPPCWSKLGTGYYNIMSTMPASGTRNMYQYSPASKTPLYIILPNFTNISIGNSQLRFKARVYQTDLPGKLFVGYLTDINNPNSFVELATLIINNSTYNINSEHIIPLLGVPMNARLAIKNLNDGKAYYWDDLYYESNQLSTEEISSSNNEKVSIYPNPTKGVFYISHYEKIELLTISDILGHSLKTLKKPTESIDISFLDKGDYLIRFIMKDGNQYSTKLIKQ